MPPVDLTTDHKENGELNSQSGGIGRGLQSCVVKLEAFAQKRPLFFAAVLVTVLFAGVIWAMPPAYQTNDDAIMNMIASGEVISLEPDEHLFCTNIIIGKLLKTLYVRYPGFLWYGWYLETTQWLATIALLYCFLQPNYSRLRVLYFMAYFFTAGIYFIVNLQFTSTAMLSGLAGIMLLLQMLRTPDVLGLRKLTLAAVAGLFLIWGGLIRNETFMLSLLLACPVFFVLYWFGDASRRTGMAVCCVLGLASSCLYLASKYDQEAYREPAWQSFYQYAHSYYNKLFDMRLIDYTPETKYVFDQVGWSQNDFEMMLNTYYYDDPVFDPQILNSILTSHPWMQDRKYGTLLWETVENVLGHRVFQAILGCLPLLLLFFDRSKRRDYWPCALAFVTAVALLPALALMRKSPPERVFVPVMAFPWLVLLSSLALQCSDASGKLSRIIQSVKFSWQYRNWSFKNSGWSKHLLLRTITLLLVIGVGLNVRKQYRLGKDNVRNAARYESMLDDIRSATIDSKSVVVAFARDFPYERHPALFRGSDYSGLHIYCVGWIQRSPLAARMKEHFGISSLGEALAYKNDMFVLTSSFTRMNLMRYLAQHFRPDLEMVNVKKFQRYYCYKSSYLTKIQPVPVREETSSSKSAALPFKPIFDSLIQR